MTSWEPDEEYAPEPTIDGPFVLRRFIQFGIMLVIGGALVFSSSRIGGVAGIALAVFGVLLVAVAVWSILFMTVIEQVRRKIGRLNGE